MTSVIALKNYGYEAVTVRIDEKYVSLAERISEKTGLILGKYKTN